MLRDSLTFLAVVAALTGVAGLMIWLFSRAMRAARRGVPGASGAGWALLFLSSGRMPPPPPASQIEQEMHTRDEEP